MAEAHLQKWLPAEESTAWVRVQWRWPPVAAELADEQLPQWIKKRRPNP